VAASRKERAANRLFLSSIKRLNKPLIATLAAVAMIGSAYAYWPQPEQHIVKIDGWWAGDFAVTACQSRMDYHNNADGSTQMFHVHNKYDCEQDTVWRKEYDFSMNLKAAMMSNKDCYRVQVGWFGGFKRIGNKEDAEILDDTKGNKKFMTIIVDYNIDNDKQNYSLMHEGSELARGSDLTEQIATRICSIMANPATEETIVVSSVIPID
jgi:hypothetical protein